MGSVVALFHSPICHNLRRSTLLGNQLDPSRDLWTLPKNVSKKLFSSFPRFELKSNLLFHNFWCWKLSFYLIFLMKVHYVFLIDSKLTFRWLLDEAQNWLNFRFKLWTKRKLWTFKLSSLNVVRNSIIHFSNDVSFNGFCAGDVPSPQGHRRDGGKSSDWLIRRNQS